MSRSVLIVDDDPVQRRLLEAAVTRLGCRAVTVDSGEAALAHLDREGREPLSAIVLDLIMPGLSGLDVLGALAKRRIGAPVLVQTAQGSIETAVAAMRAGAFDFVVKPVSPERLRSALESAFKVGSFESAARRKEHATGGKGSFSSIVAGSGAMDRVVSLARKAASSDIPVLIEGESGVGKELVARAIRSASPRRGKPFVVVNCGAIPENLVESILFGHEKGSFTGATERHTGKFVEADGGTLFLDEVGELPPSAQVKLLRAVQQGEVDPVGGRATVKVDVRLISATNRDLDGLVREGRFREDLFYRLNVFPLVVPPLRERREDIPLLVGHFIERHGGEAGATHVRGISVRALDLLQSYDWPGNIRQLENAILRAVVLAEGEVLTLAQFPQIAAQLDGVKPVAALTDLPAQANSADAAPAEPVDDASPAILGGAASPRADAQGMLKALDGSGEVRPLVDLESEMIRFAIDHYDGQMSEVARRLGIGRSTLYRKLREFGIDPARRESQRG